jgi:hypothetical protein
LSGDEERVGQKDKQRILNLKNWDTKEEGGLKRELERRAIKESCKAELQRRA